MSRMSAVLWSGLAYPNGLQWCEVERPKPPPGWVLVRNRATGICGSDIHYLSGAMVHQVPKANFPTVLGHENAGEIVEIGAGVSGWEVGNRVALEPIHPCRTFDAGFCRACMTGEYHRCSQLSFVGIPANHPLPGGYGEYSLYHASCVFPLPDAIEFQEAAILDVLACSVHAINLGQPSPRSTIIVLGCGPIGLCTIQALRAAGVNDIVAVGKYSYQTEYARTQGARETVCLEETPDAVAEMRRLIGAADQVYECVGGNSDTLQQGIEICRPGGKIIVLGFFTGFKSINLETFFLKDLAILSSDGYSMCGQEREFDIALGFLANKQADLKGMITHVFPRSEWKRALDTAFDRRTNRALKIVFVD